MALIDDNSPTPAHARNSTASLLRTSIIGLVLWGSVMAALILSFGWDGLLTRMGWFFTKAALLTFGGAYAVLPYVFQGAVDQFAWLNAGQMIDGLALFFAWHVYWPQGWHGPFEWPALLIGLGALYALSRWPTRVILIIAGAAVAGLVV